MDLNFILQHTVGNLYWKDKTGRYLGANQAFISLAGLKQFDDIIGKTDRELFYSVMSNEKLILLEETDRRILSSGIGENLKEEGIDENGNPAFYMTSKIPLRNDKGEITGLMGTSLDITKEMQADIARSEFLANMRHDIRTPLSGIVGFSELLKSESNEPRIKEYADNLIASSHALLDLMDEVLEAVRVSSGEIPMLKRKFNLTQSMEQVIALYQARAHEKKLRLSISLDKTLPHFVIGDKIRLHRIALELIGNALNFTDTGHVSVKVDLAKKEHRELVIKLTVSDSGMGIPKEKQQEIYLQFKRLTPSYQGIYKGAGLGLYVVKQFIDELGGEIYVESEPRIGTVFTCLIPMQAPLLDDASGIDPDENLKLEKSYIPPLKNQTSTPTNSKECNAKSKVLVVEDNFIAQTVAKTLLSGMDCHVDVASSGSDALALYEQTDYDLIFMDIGLGEGMDGYEVTHYIRSKISSTRHIPIIALTAHGGDESKQRCIEAGMDAVLTKPLTQAHAADIIKSFIPERHETPIVDYSMARKDLPDSNDEMFQLNQFPILNSDEALKNCATQEMLKELLTLMTQELPNDLERMKIAFKAHDFPLVEKTAHKIKGGAVYVGTTRMKYACQYVERYWKTGQRELFDALYHQAINTIEETLTYIEGWLQRDTPDK
ncbi:ATP-binding protein [Legionella pneumophila]|uniref:response regulator n=1 Tax=Legionella pneumophila TaxID=446 RepID=UPI0022B3909E|nr:response regulator [Legionella pneumophila]MCZ4786705.1 ATP-binding protein [Legionella pneumophila]